MSKKPQLKYEPKSCWEVYSGPAHASAMDELAVRYIKYLSEVKTEREVVRQAADAAGKAGYSEDVSSGKVFRTLHGKTILLARKGKKGFEHGFRLLGAHGDSPRLDLKQRPLYEDCSVSQAKTHYYGGIRKHQWLARPLALHGVAVKKDGTVVRVVLGEGEDEPVFMIPDLLPHLAQDQMEKTLSKAFEAEKLNIILGHSPEGWDKEKIKDKDKSKKDKTERIKEQVLRLLYEKYGIVEEDLYSAELQAVPAGPARFVGLDRALVGGYAHDDRICVFSALEALLGVDEPEHAVVVIFWDKEEIGSDGATGAKSLFLEYCLQELIEAWSPGVSLAQTMLNAKALSTDVHGALDPDYQELHEKLNSALIGYGPCFCKFTGHRGKYSASEASAEYVGWLRGVMARENIPWQMAELGKVDLGGGGTVAKHLAAYGMDVIDFGPPILSMHSPFEICSKADLYATVKAFKAFMES